MTAFHLTMLFNVLSTKMCNCLVVFMRYFSLLLLLNKRVINCFCLLRQLGIYIFLTATGCEMGGGWDARRDIPDGSRPGPLAKPGGAPKGHPGRDPSRSPVGTRLGPGCVCWLGSVFGSADIAHRRLHNDVLHITQGYIICLVLT